LDSRRKIIIMSAAIIAFLAFISTAQQGLSQPITSRVIVKMDNSYSVNLASGTLKENMPDAMIVDYNSPAYFLVIWRAYGGVVWVGHGSQEGVNTEQGLLSWETLAARVESTPSKDVVLACYSAAILSYVSRSLVTISFKGDIDARMGALVVSYLLTGSPTIILQATQLAEALMTGKTVATTLGLTNDEVASFFIGLLILIFYGAPIGAALREITGLARLIVATAWTDWKFTIIQAASAWQSGKLSPLDLAAAVLYIVFSVAWLFITHTNWWTALIDGSWLAFKFGVLGALFIVAFIVGLAWLLIQLIVDIYD